MNAPAHPNGYITERADLRELVRQYRVNEQQIRRRDARRATRDHGARARRVADRTMAEDSLLAFGDDRTRQLVPLLRTERELLTRIGWAREKNIKRPELHDRLVPVRAEITLITTKAV